MIFVHRVGGTFSLLGSNRRGEEEKDINDASISSFPSVSSEYFYWALVTADDIRVFFNPVLKIFVGFTAFLSALVASRVSFIRRVLLEVFIEERLFGQV